MSDIKININTQGGAIITGGEFHDMEFVANKYVIVNENTHRRKYEDIEDAQEVQEKVLNNFSGSSKEDEIPESVKECFRFPSEFVKQEIVTIVNDFYLNKPVYLAIIEVALYDHGQLYKRNSHTSFICALMDWGILPEDTDIRKTANGMATKFRSFPSEGYKQWNNYLLNERNLCTNIGNRLPVSMKYNR